MLGHFLDAFGPQLRPQGKLEKVIAAHRRSTTKLRRATTALKSWSAGGGGC
jgi:hypothetical protein